MVLEQKFGNDQIEQQYGYADFGNRFGSGFTHFKCPTGGVIALKTSQAADDKRKHNPFHHQYFGIQW